MRKAGTGRIIVATVVVLAAIGVVGLTMGRRLPFARAWGNLASSVASTVASSVAALPSSLAPPEPIGDAGVAMPEAGDAPRAVHKQTAPLSSAQLGAPLVHGTFVTACGAPDDMKVAIKLAVRMGHAVDVKVTTEPDNPAVASCIERATRDMQWDISPKTGRVTVRY